MLKISFNQSATAQTKNFEQKSKVVSDLKAREEERAYRETQIIKDLKPQKDILNLIDKSLVKDIRKLLMMTLDSS